MQAGIGALGALGALGVLGALGALSALEALGALGALGALEALGVVFRRDHPFSLREFFLGGMGVSSCSSPGGDGEQLSVGGPFEATGKYEW